VPQNLDNSETLVGVLFPNNLSELRTMFLNKKNPINVANVGAKIGVEEENFS